MVMFYIITTTGIVFCLTLAKFLIKIPIIKNIFSIIGKHSFAIMALHFVFIKSVDVIYSYFINETRPEIIGKWITSYPNKLFIAYLIAGTLIPVLFSITFDFVNEKVLNNIFKLNGEKHEKIL